jgi:transposase InsO family protein
MVSRTRDLPWRLRGAAGHAELRLGLAVRCGRKRVARLMRAAGLAGVCHRRKWGRADPLPAPHTDLVQRRFVAEAPDRLWVRPRSDGRL